MLTSYFASPQRGGVACFFIMMKNKKHLTKAGFKKLKEEHERLKKEKRIKAIDKVQKTRLMGDLSENSAYHAAREELANIEGRIKELETILDEAVIIEKQLDNSSVQIGHKVKVSKDGKTTLFEIVGEYESDPEKNRLSHQSPIGRSLLGKKVGEVVKIKVPAGIIAYRIEEII